ncbi:ATP-binding protein [Streptomyces litchfieldiae]|uniref:ATP-binding protein n=1 Tax=Streptomyces litchfieldiae TaxID=3075543 RepID=A0ABU2N1B0_9ACTN|nr:ATP-binding protein [Streptomyces sp. DSM 44938]MDT0347536.1 ATP-binding protein [Streptomyces sp. DSM 44938]
MTPQFTGGTLVVLVGPSAAGKSTWCAQFPSSWRVNLDTYREMVTDSAASQSGEAVVAQIQDLVLDARLARNLTTLVDNTSLLVHARARLLAQARYYQRPCVAVLFDHVDLAERERRNAARVRQVPTDILRWQDTLIPTAEQLRSEGFMEVLPALEAVGAATGGRVG